MVAAPGEGRAGGDRDVARADRAAVLPLGDGHAVVRALSGKLGGVERTGLVNQDGAGLVVAVLADTIGDAAVVVDRAVLRPSGDQNRRGCNELRVG